jgi:hypothetical protein
VPIQDEKVAVDLVIDSLRVDHECAEVETGEELASFTQHTHGVHDCVTLGGTHNVKGPHKAVLVLLNDEASAHSSEAVE